MWPAIDTFQHDRIDLPAEFLDTLDHLDSEFGLQLLGETIDAVPTRFDILAAAFESGHNSAARHVSLAGGIIQQPCEGDNMGGVQANHAEAKFGCRTINLAAVNHRLQKAIVEIV